MIFSFTVLKSDSHPTLSIYTYVNTTEVTLFVMWLLVAGHSQFFSLKSLHWALKEKVTALFAWEMLLLLDLKIPLASPPWDRRPPLSCKRALWPRRLTLHFHPCNNAPYYQYCNTNVSKKEGKPDLSCVHQFVSLRRRTQKDPWGCAWLCMCLWYNFVHLRLRLYLFHHCEAIHYNQLRNTEPIFTSVMCSSEKIQLKKVWKPDMQIYREVEAGSDSTSLSCLDFCFQERRE